MGAVWCPPPPSPSLLVLTSPPSFSTARDRPLACHVRVRQARCRGQPGKIPIPFFCNPYSRFSIIVNPLLPCSSQLQLFYNQQPRQKKLTFSERFNDGSCRLPSRRVERLGDREWLGRGKFKVLEFVVAVAQVEAENSNLSPNFLYLTKPKRTTLILAVLVLQL